MDKLLAAIASVENAVAELDYNDTVRVIEFVLRGVQTRHTKSLPEEAYNQYNRNPNSSTSAMGKFLTKS